MRVRIRRSVKVEDIDIKKDNLRDFGFPGVSLEEGPLTGPLSPGHLDAVVTEPFLNCCCAALFLGNPVNKQQTFSMKPHPEQKRHSLLYDERVR